MIFEAAANKANAVAQKRGGKGRSGMATKEEDFVRALYIVNTHTPVLFFSTAGMVYKLKVYKLPEGTPQSRGKAMVNLLPLEEGEEAPAKKTPPNA